MLMPCPQNKQLTSPDMLNPSIRSASLGFVSLTQLRICFARQSGQIGFVIISSQTTQLDAAFSIGFLILALFRRHLQFVFERLNSTLTGIQNASVGHRDKPSEYLTPANLV